jgi:hypothetical protein
MARRRSILAAFGRLVDGLRRRGRGERRKFVSINPEQWA